MTTLPRKKVVKSASEITKELSKFVTNQTIVTKQRTRKERSLDTETKKIKKSIEDINEYDTDWTDSSTEINEDVDENE